MKLKERWKALLSFLFPLRLVRTSALHGMKQRIDYLEDRKHYWTEKYVQCSQEYLSLRQSKQAWLDRYEHLQNDYLDVGHRHLDLLNKLEELGELRKSDKQEGDTTFEEKASPEVYDPYPPFDE